MKEKLTCLCKSMCVAILISVVLCILISWLSCLLHISEKIIAVLITITYITSCLFGGFCMGRGRNRRFLYGSIIGVVYCIIIGSFSCIFLNTPFLDVLKGSGIILALCVASSMFGGMIA